MTRDAVVPELTPRELARRLGESESLVLLDVREPIERAYCSIAAPSGIADLHVPTGRIVENLDALRTWEERAPIVVYCHHGVRSRNVAEWLAAQGIQRVENLAGGIDAWSRDVDAAVPRY